MSWAGNKTGLHDARAEQANVACVGMSSERWPGHANIWSTQCGQNASQAAPPSRSPRLASSPWSQGRLCAAEYATPRLLWLCPEEPLFLPSLSPTRPCLEKLQSFCVGQQFGKPAATASWPLFVLQSSAPCCPQLLGRRRKMQFQAVFHSAHPTAFSNSPWKSETIQREGFASFGSLCLASRCLCLRLRFTLFLLHEATSKPVSCRYVFRAFLLLLLLCYSWLCGFTLGTRLGGCRVSWRYMFLKHSETRLLLWKLLLPVQPKHDETHSERLRACSPTLAQLARGPSPSCSTVGSVKANSSKSSAS